ncbi:MAG: DUF4129 domain-containing protein [Armatimonadetes bacterium]|nr:DUF4129 domain-containing protein [Armatimonadota bacterium]
MRQRPLAGLVVLSLLLAACPARAVPVEEYRQRLEASISSLAPTSRTKDADAKLAALRTSFALLSSLKSVELHDGRSVPLDFRWLEDGSQTSSRSIDQVVRERRNALSLYRDELDWYVSGQFRTEPRSSVWAREIVRRKEFRLHIPWIQTFLYKVLYSLAKFLGEHTTFHGWRVTYWVLVAVGALCVIGIIVYLTYSLRRTLVKEGQVRSDSEADFLERLRSSAEWQAFAAECAARGEFRSAVRGLFHGLLALMDEKQFIQFDRNRTNRENLAALHLDSQPDEATRLQPHLAQTLRFFERKWYGLEPCSAGEYSGFHNDLSSLTAHLGSLKVAAPEGAAT